MLEIVEVWTDILEDGGYGDIMTDLEDLQKMHGEDVNFEQGYVIVDDKGISPDESKDIYFDFFEAQDDLARIEGGISIGPDYLRIYYNGEELIGWQEDEWVKEPRLAINLANAVHLYYTKGPRYIQSLIRGEEV